MKLFEPAKAVSFTKLGLGPLSIRYKFQKGTPIGAQSREDEIWMGSLVASGMLVCVENTNPQPMRKAPVRPTREPGLTTADLLPHTKPKVIREKGYQTNRDFEAKIAVAKSEERMRLLGEAQEKIKFGDQDIQDFSDFLEMQIGDSEPKMIAAINAEYLEEPLMNLCKKLELDIDGDKKKLIANLIDWFSLKKYKEEDKPEEVKLVKTPEKVIEEDLIEEEILAPDVFGFKKLLETLTDNSEDEKIEAIKLEYSKKDLISLCEKLELDSEGNKGVLGGRIVDWFNLKGE